MAQKGYITIEALDGGFIIEVGNDASHDSNRQVVSSKGKAIKIIRDALDVFEGSAESAE
jgi:hypothetical protein